MSTPGISFGFTKSKALSAPAVKQDDVDAVEDVQSIAEFTGTKKSDENKEPELIIPLQKTNTWRAPAAGALKAASIDELVVQELMRDAAKFEERALSEAPEQALDAIPILMQNRPPMTADVADESVKFKLDVAQRPDEATLEDYERVPVSLIGEALLKGMGWHKGEAIGGKNKALMQPIEYVPRPKGQGLGAQRNSELAPHAHKGKREKFVKPGEKRGEKAEMVVPVGPDGRVRHYKTIDETLVEREVIGIKKGNPVLIQEGPHKGYTARISEVTMTTLRVKLAINSTEMTLPRDYVKAISEADYKSIGVRRVANSDSESHASSKVQVSSHRDDDEAEHKVKRKPRESWLHKNIRVRIVSSTYKGGKYYNLKAVVADVTRPGLCNVITAEGKMLEELTDADLETIVPKESNSRVMVVRGTHRGQVGRMNKRYAEDSTVAVMLNQETDAVLLSFDDVSEFVGEAALDDYD